jgi:hypothetical protein
MLYIRHQTSQSSIVFSSPSQSSPVKSKRRNNTKPKSLGLLSKSMCFPLLSREQSPQRFSDFLDFTRSKCRIKLVYPLTPMHRRLLPDLSATKIVKRPRVSVKSSPSKAFNKPRSLTDAPHPAFNFDLSPWSASTNGSGSPI